MGAGVFFGPVAGVPLGRVFGHTRSLAGLEDSMPRPEDGGEVPGREIAVYRRDVERWAAMTRHYVESVGALSGGALYVASTLLLPRGSEELFFSEVLGGALLGSVVGYFGAWYSHEAGVMLMSLSDTIKKGRRNFYYLAPLVLGGLQFLTGFSIHWITRALR